MILKSAMMWLALSIQTMTRLPIKKQFDASPTDYANSAGWFFLTSLVVGGISALVYFVFSFVPLIGAFLSVFAAYLVTGALHIDGFGDVCDAFFAGKDKEKTLAILKDSRMGTYGVLGIVFMVGIKTLLIYNQSFDIIPVIICAPVSAKIPMLFCALLGKYPRKNGLGNYLVTNLSQGTALISILLCFATTLIVAGILISVIAFVCMILLGLIVQAISNRKIGGVTGDVLGAANEMGEAIFLLVAVIV